MKKNKEWLTESDYINKVKELEEELMERNIDISKLDIDIKSLNLKMKSMYLSHILIIDMAKDLKNPQPDTDIKFLKNYIYVLKVIIKFTLKHIYLQNNKTLPDDELIDVFMDDIKDLGKDDPDNVMKYMN
jgi:hypothetical protein